MPADNAKTIVITGASSGIGKAAARLFHEKGWNVVATMRRPEAETDLRPSERMKLAALDVQDAESPRKAVAEAIAAFGRIDVWLNNAGYGAFGPVEAGTREQIAAVRRQRVRVDRLRAGGRRRISATALRDADQCLVGRRDHDAAVLQRLQRDSSSRSKAFPKDCGTNSARSAFKREARRARRDQDRVRRPVRRRVGHFPNLPDYAGFMQKVKAAREKFTKTRARRSLSPR